MKIRFKNKKLQKTCETEKELNKAFGRRARKIRLRLAVLGAAETLMDVSHLPPTRRHQLSQDRDEEFAIDIEGQWRIIFIPDHEEIPRKEDEGIDIEKVTAILIIDICEDYH